MFKIVSSSDIPLKSIDQSSENSQFWKVIERTPAEVVKRTPVESKKKISVIFSLNQFI